METITMLHQKQHNQHIAQNIKELWNNYDADNDSNYIPNFSNYPSKIKDNTIKNRRLIMYEILENKLNTLYENESQIMEMKKTQMTTKSMQNKYYFTQKFRDIVINGLEVNCRMITTNQGQTNQSYNLTRIGGITFKGKFKDLIEKLMEKCKTEITTKYGEKINEIKSAVMYMSYHSSAPFSKCKWDCNAIERTIRKKPYYNNFFKNQATNVTDIGEKNNIYINNESNSLCYYDRQILGQSLIPFVYDDNDDDDEESSNNIISSANDENTFIFDDMFMVQNTIAGISIYPIRAEPNFFDTVDRNACTALISFSLFYIGVTNGCMNLYLKCQPDRITYCTNVSSVRDIPKVSNYLIQQMYSNPQIIDILENRHKMIISTCIKNEISKLKEEKVEIEEVVAKRRKYNDDDDDNDENEDNNKQDYSMNINFDREEEDNDDDEDEDEDDDDDDNINKVLDTML